MSLSRGSNSRSDLLVADPNISATIPGSGTTGDAWYVTQRPQITNNHSRLVWCCILLVLQFASLIHYILPTYLFYLFLRCTRPGALGDAAVAGQETASSSPRAPPGGVHDGEGNRQYHRSRTADVAAELCDWPRERRRCATSGSGIGALRCTPARTAGTWCFPLRDLLRYTSRRG
jgi:hypothetical protein